MKVQVSEETRRILERSYSPKAPFMRFELYSYGLLTETLGKEANRVLGYMLKKMVYGNKIHLTQSQIAKELELLPQNVNRAVRELIKELAIYEAKPITNEACYLFNPDYGWMGDEKERLKLAQLLDHVNIETGVVKLDPAEFGVAHSEYLVHAVIGELK